MDEKRTPEEISTELQNLNEVYDAKVEELSDKKRTLDDVSTELLTLDEVYGVKMEELSAERRAEREILNAEYWARVDELNQELEQIMNEEGNK